MLEILRKKIDSLDLKLLKTLSKRFKLVSKIGSFKKENNQKIIDNNREEELEKKISASARKLGLSEDFTKKLYELIIEESHRIQG